MISVKEAAGLARVSVATMRRRAASGKVKAEKVGRAWVVDKKSVPLGKHEIVTLIFQSPISSDVVECPTPGWRVISADPATGLVTIERE